ncbi:FecR family protein [Thalassospira sp. MCCC 1A01428]|uniref:FecR family protein n=1 Tax=Thalassospira sp. MCCC 1A01428 TaxID=1470575 RepID=UPI000A1DB8E3|nr:FecR domain-containing protein [Thalassospira sp. MCCC 1A01428]OSQ45072.1 hypothetical protein THS27_05135 [Thalassospira sp. MCCC 1A01428]
MAGPDQSEAEQEQAARDWWHVMADDASAVENFAAFAQWCDAVPGNRETFDRISLAYQQSRTAPPLRAKQVRRQEPRHKPARRPNPLRRLGMTLAGAGFALVAALSAVAIIPRDAAWQEIDLADGSVASVAPGSDYDIAFNDQFRNIRLAHGSIVISAAKDRQRPMQVITDQATVRVVGTKFAVSIIGNDVETSVLEGIVGVRGNAGDSRNYELKPGDRLWLGAGHDALQTTVPLANALEIRKGWQSFRNAPLADVLDGISRHSGHRFVLSPLYQGQKRITGRFNLTRADQTIAVLAKLAPITIQPVTGNLTLVY